MTRQGCPLDFNWAFANRIHGCGSTYEDAQGLGLTEGNASVGTQIDGSGPNQGDDHSSASSGRAIVAQEVDNNPRTTNPRDGSASASTLPLVGQTLSPHHTSSPVPTVESSSKSQSQEDGRKQKSSKPERKKHKRTASTSKDELTPDTPSIKPTPQIVQSYRPTRETGSSKAMVEWIMEPIAKPSATRGSKPKCKAGLLRIS